MHNSRTVFGPALFAFIAGTAQAQITNQDDCASSGIDNVGPGVHTYDNSAATTGSQGQNESTCSEFGTTGIDSDIWFTYTATTSGVTVINTCGAVDDTKIAVYPGSPACPPDGTSLDCNDDTCGTQSRVSFPTVAGASYIIQVGNFPGAASTGSNMLDISVVPTHPNDECANAIAINGPGAYGFDSTGATTSAPAWPCGSGGADIWYRFTAPNTSMYLFDTCSGTGHDTTLELLDGTCGALTSLACNDDFCGLQSSVTLPAVQGTDYYLRVGGYNGEIGPGTLNVTEFFPNPSLSNQDECANASIDMIGAGAYDWDNSAATTGGEGQTEVNCYKFGTSGIQSDVWAVYTVGVSGSVTIETCGAIGSNTDTKVAAYPLAPCGTIDGTSVNCNDDTCGTLSQIVFNVNCGETYLLQLGSFPGSGDGTSTLFINESGTVCGPGPIGMPASCPGIPNSTGAVAALTIEGQVNVGAMDVRLFVDSVPPGQFGMFFTSQTLGFVQNPGGSLGNICVIGNQGRYNMISQIFTGSGPGAPVPPGGLQVGNIPVPVNPPIPAFTVGSPWYFQAWHRDIGGTNNFSNVTMVTFGP